MWIFGKVPLMFFCFRDILRKDKMLLIFQTTEIIKIDGSKF